MMITCSLFSQVLERNNGVTLQQEIFRLDINKNFLSVRMVKDWSRLTRDVEFQSLEVFKGMLYNFCLGRLRLRWSYLEQRIRLNWVSKWARRLDPACKATGSSPWTQGFGVWQHSASGGFSYATLERSS